MWVQNISGEGPKLENLRGKSEHTCWVTRKVSPGSAMELSFVGGDYKQRGGRGGHSLSEGLGPEWDAEQLLTGRLEERAGAGLHMA